MCRVTNAVESVCCLTYSTVFVIYLFVEFGIYHIKSCSCNKILNKIVKSGTFCRLLWVLGRLGIKKKLNDLVSSIPPHSVKNNQLWKNIGRNLEFV